MILSLLACRGPWAAVAERERPWWEDAARLEEVEGIDLVELPSGEPLGYWPRIVIRPDRLELDARAWFLALPPEILRMDEVFAELPEGEVDPVGEAAGLEPYPELQGRLEALYESMARFDAATGVVVLVPDARVSERTIARVASTAGQARFGSYTLAGAAEARVRAAWASGPPCPARVTVEGGGIVADGERVGTCGDPLPTLEALWTACGPTWATLPPEDRCLDVGVVLGDGTARDLLTTLGALHATEGRLRVTQLAARLDAAPGCSGGAAVEALPPATLERICGGPDPRPGSEPLHRLEELLRRRGH